jgi:hypothetical protein
MNIFSLVCLWLVSTLFDNAVGKLFLEKTWLANLNLVVFLGICYGLQLTYVPRESMKRIAGWTQVMSALIIELTIAFPDDSADLKLNSIALITACVMAALFFWMPPPFESLLTRSVELRKRVFQSLGLFSSRSPAETSRSSTTSPRPPSTTSSEISRETLKNQATRSDPKSAKPQNAPRPKLDDTDFDRDLDLPKD